MGRVKDKVSQILEGRQLPDSGTISLNQIHVEAGGTSGTNCSINDADIRGLIGKNASTRMSFSEWYGASNLITKGIVYHDTWHDLSPKGASIDLSSKINNQSTSSYEQRKGSDVFPGGAAVYGHNKAYATAIGSVTAIRKFMVYGVHDYYVGPGGRPWLTQSWIADPAGNIGVYGQGSQRTQHSIPSIDMVAMFGFDQCGNWIKDGIHMRHTWTFGYDNYPSGIGAKLFGCYFDVDFDFIPA